MSKNWKEFRKELQEKFKSEKHLTVDDLRNWTYTNSGENIRRGYLIYGLSTYVERFQIVKGSNLTDKCNE